MGRRCEAQGLPLARLLPWDLTSSQTQTLLCGVFIESRMDQGGFRVEMAGKAGGSLVGSLRA